MNYVVNKCVADVFSVCDFITIIVPAGANVILDKEQKQ